MPYLNPALKNLNSDWWEKIRSEEFMTYAAAIHQFLLFFAKL